MTCCNHSAVPVILKLVQNPYFTHNTKGDCHDLLHNWNLTAIQVLKMVTRRDVQYYVVPPHLSAAILHAYTSACEVQDNGTAS